MMWLQRVTQVSLKILHLLSQAAVVSFLTMFLIMQCSFYTQTSIILIFKWKQIEELTLSSLAGMQLKLMWHF